VTSYEQLTDHYAAAWKAGNPKQLRAAMRHVQREDERYLSSITNFSARRTDPARRRMRARQSRGARQGARRRQPASGRPRAA
jgi:hypothetical protein